MARPAPSADRVVAVLNFFAEHPDHGFSLTDVIRSLHLNRATCHGLLGTLAERGYLYRDAAKTYRMGPALAAIGRVAYQSFAPVAAAQDEMRRLADQHDLNCMAASRVGNEMVFLERMVSRSNLEPAFPAQRRNAIRPPGGSSFITWGPQSEIDGWLKAFEPALDADERALVLAALARMRRLGFAYSIPSQQQEETTDPLLQMAGGWTASADRPHFFPEFGPELHPDTLYPVSYLSSPVIGAASEVLFTISLNGFRTRIAGSAILSLGEELRECAGRVSKTLTPRSRSVPV